MFPAYNTNTHALKLKVLGYFLQKSSRFFVSILWKTARRLCVIKLPCLIHPGENASFFRKLRKIIFRMFYFKKLTSYGSRSIQVHLRSIWLFWKKNDFLVETYGTIRFFAFIFHQILHFLGQLSLSLKVSPIVMPKVEKTTFFFSNCALFSRLLSQFPSP